MLPSGNLTSVFILGVGYAICLMALYVSSYYNTVIAWAVFYLYRLVYGTRIVTSFGRITYNEPCNLSERAAFRYLRWYVIEF